MFPQSKDLLIRERDSYDLRCSTLHGITELRVVFVNDLVFHGIFIHEVKDTFHPSFRTCPNRCTLNGCFQVRYPDVLHLHIIQRRTVLIGSSDRADAGRTGKSREVRCRPFLVYIRESKHLGIQIIGIFIIQGKGFQSLLPGRIIPDILLDLLGSLRFHINFPSNCDHSRPGIAAFSR